MSLLALLLVVFSAVSHPLWNLLLKRARDKLVASWLLWVTGALCMVPFAVWGALSEPVQPTVWRYALGTSVVYVGYSLLLARSYARGEISLVYPISKGVGPLGAAALAGIVLGERLPPLGLWGIMVVAAAVLVISWPERERRAPASPRLSAAVWPAIGVGLATATYSVIDKQGVKYASPLLYLLLTNLGAAVLMAPLVLARRGWAAVGREVRSSGWPTLWGAGALLAGGYLLVLFALRLAPAGYVVAVRSTSVLFAVLLGHHVLGEPRVVQRSLLGLAVLAGLAMLALAK